MWGVAFSVFKAVEYKFRYWARFKGDGSVKLFTYAGLFLTASLMLALAEILIPFILTFLGSNYFYFKGFMIRVKRPDFSVKDRSNFVAEIFLLVIFWIFCFNAVLNGLQLH